jgi:two-component system, NarL family, response regulator NreC
METQKIRILIVDDHAVLRAGLHMLLDAEEDMLVVGEAPGVDQAVAQLAHQAPDVVLVDISMPEINGLEGLKSMREKAPDSKFLMLTMHNDESYLRLALSAGASGYVLKQAANNELLSAIRVVSQGGTYLHSGHRSILFEGESGKQASTPGSQDEADYERLSPREKEILRLIAMGYTNRQAAEELFLSEKTIETYKSRLMAKLALHSRTELVRYALRLGLIQS